ncbi:MAG: ATP-binding cassette domain-containing protein, partial [Gemmataceae bacterium]
RAALKPDDFVYLGSFRVPAARLLTPSNLGASAAVAIRQDGVITLGRAPDCDQVLDFPMISSRHARLARQAGGFLLEDLQSTNGTFVNGQRVSRVSVRPGDVIALGSYQFTVTDTGLRKKDTRGNTTLESYGLCVRAGGRTLISDVNLTIFPGEFCGLMGPSGAGKTTLMTALNGYMRPASGLVMINGQDLYKHYDQYRSVLGYVPQDDVMHRDLTVGQALYYSARLRLPPDYSHADIQKRIAAVLKQLSLEGTENVLIGSAEVKGISGGQRRRVNLGMELLTDPQILFLDEPTSGLSSQDALTVMKVLRKLADDGKTILLTIHQPSLDVYRLMDHLVLMGKDRKSPDPGRLVYFGPAYPDAVQHFNPEGVPDLKPGQEPSPDAVLSGLDKGKTGDWVTRFESSELHARFVRERAGSRPEADEAEDASRGQKVSSLSQWWMLVQRLVSIKLRDRMNTAVLLAQAPIIAVLIVAVFSQEMNKPVGDPLGLAKTMDTDAHKKWVDDHRSWVEVAQTVQSSLFLMSLAALWFGASNAVREIVGERAVYHRERMVSLRILPYVASKYAVLGIIALIQCLTLLGVVYLGCGLKAPAVLALVIMMLAAMVGTTIGLLLSAVSKTNEMAITLLPIVLLPMVILSGAILSVDRMPAGPRAVSLGIPTRWGYEGLLLLESKERPKGREPTPPVLPGMEEPAKKAEKDVAEASFPKDKYRGSPLLAALVLSGMMAAGAAGIVGILRAQDVH